MIKNLLKKQVKTKCYSNLIFLIFIFTFFSLLFLFSDGIYKSKRIIKAITNPFYYGINHVFDFNGEITAIRNRLLYKPMDEEEFNKTIHEYLNVANNLYKNSLKDYEYYDSKNFIKILQENQIYVINSFIEISDEQKKYLSTIDPNANIGEIYSYYKNQNLVPLTHDKIYKRNKFYPLNFKQEQNLKKTFLSSYDNKQVSNINGEKLSSMLKQQRDIIKLQIDKYGLNNFVNSAYFSSGFLSTFSNANYENNITYNYNFISYDKNNTKDNLDELIDLFIYLQVKSFNEIDNILKYKYPDYKKMSKIDVNRILVKELKEKNVFPLNYDNLK